MIRVLIDERIQLQHGTAHLKVTQLSRPITRSRGTDGTRASGGHAFKYRLAYLEGKRVRVLYDVHTGKADHKHIDGVELPYEFVSLQQLSEDFFKDKAEMSR